MSLSSLLYAVAGNIAGVISSHPIEGTKIHGLTPKGRDQARLAGQELLDAIGGIERVNSLFVYSSNFTRARQTAKEVVDSIRGLTNANVPVPVTITPALRERWFGKLDNTIITNYNLVWPADLRDAACIAYDVESVDQVCLRLRVLILELEQQHAGAAIALVSHADTLQILQTYVAGADARTFSSYRFKNGEVRALLQDDPASLPPPAPLVYSR